MTAHSSELDRLFDLDEVRSRFIPISEATVARAVKSGDFPSPVIVGRRRLWRASDLAEWIASRTPAVEVRS